MPIRLFTTDLSGKTITNSSASFARLSYRESVYAGKITGFKIYANGSTGNIRFGLYDASANLIYDNGAETRSQSGGELFEITPQDVSASTTYGTAHITDTGTATATFNETGEENIYVYVSGNVTTPLPATFTGSTFTSRGVAIELWGWIPPTVSGVNSGDPLVGGATEVSITGIDFMDSQGTNGKVYLANNSDFGSATVTVEQTVTSWSDGTIEFTVVPGALSPGTVYVFVQTDLEQMNATGYSATLSASGPSITSVNSGNPLVGGATGIAIAGSNFEASQGTNGAVYLANNAVFGSATIVAEQIVTSWSDTALEITVNRDILDAGAVYLFVQNDSEDMNSTGYEVQLIGGERRLVGLEWLTTGISNGPTTINSIIGTVHEALETGKITRFRVAATETVNVKVGIYNTDTGIPDTALWTDNTGTSIGGTGGVEWGDIDVDGVAVVSGEDYYPAVLSETSYRIPYNSGGSGVYYSQLYSTGVPSTLSGESTNPFTVQTQLWGWTPPIVSSVNEGSSINAADTDVSLVGLDLMAAAGTNGKLELCNNSDYSAATIRVEQTDTSWDNDGIIFDVVQGALSTGTVYAFVTTDLGQRNSVGVAVTLMGDVPVVGNKDIVSFFIGTSF